MSTLRFAPGTFLVAYCIAYVVVFANDWPLFRYYPLRDRFSFGAQVLPGEGPAMAWYGLMASAALVAAFAALLVPERLSDKVFARVAWIFPCATMLISVYLLRQFFL